LKYDKKLTEINRLIRKATKCPTRQAAEQLKNKAQEAVNVWVKTRSNCHYQEQLLEKAANHLHDFVLAEEQKENDENQQPKKEKKDAI
ncbi:MAG: hypothetical protein ACX936_21465, partial [Marinobacter sp.]